MCLAVPGKILEVEERDGSRVARVQFGGITRAAYLEFVPEAAVGDYVMVHVGFALSRVNAEEAARTCTPENPLGAPMVSAEGACAAYYQYRRHTVKV
jgi:hydrogenase expression/formation protein HypC